MDGQPTGAGADIDAPLPLSLVAGLDVPSRIAWIVLAGKPDGDGAAHPGALPPGAGADELAAGFPHRPGSTGLDERAALGAGDPYHGSGPRRTVVTEHAPLAQFRPGDLLACLHSTGRNRPAGAAPGSPSPALSERGTEIVRADARGRTNAEIAGEFFISLSTAKAHLANVQAKPGARNRVEIAAWARERGLMAAAGE